MTPPLETIVEEEEDDLDISPREGIITETDIRTASRCWYAQYLRTQVGMGKVPLSAFAAQSLFFKIQRKKLLPENTRAGLRLKPVERMTPEELQEVLSYRTPETCGNGWLGKWFKIAKDGKFAGREILWAFQSQSNACAQQLRNAGVVYYSSLLEHGPPVFGFMNKKQSFHFEGDIYLVEFPEIRVAESERKWFIDSPSLGGAANIHTSNLVTMKLLAFTKIAHDFRHGALYEQKWKVPSEIAEQWGGNPIYLDERVQYRHLNTRKGETTITSRSDKDLDRFRRMRDWFKENMVKENYEPNHKSCGSCPYNVVGIDGRVVCPERKKGAKPLVPNYYFKKTLFNIHVEESDREVTLRGNVWKDKTIAKPVATLTLRVEGNKVTTAYDSDVRGLGFEERMLKKATNAVQSLSDRLGRVMTHSVDYEKNFKFAGQKSIKAALENAGYENGEKVYSPTSGQLGLNLD